MKENWLRTDRRTHPLIKMRGRILKIVIGDPKSRNHWNVWASNVDWLLFRVFHLAFRRHRHGSKAFSTHPRRQNSNPPLHSINLSLGRKGLHHTGYTEIPKASVFVDDGVSVADYNSVRVGFVCPCVSPIHFSWWDNIFELKGWMFLWGFIMIILFGNIHYSIFYKDVYLSPARWWMVDPRHPSEEPQVMTWTIPSASFPQVTFWRFLFFNRKYPAGLVHHVS